MANSFTDHFWKLGFWICFGFWSRRWLRLVGIPIIIASGILMFGFWMGGCGEIEGELVSISISPSSATIGINKTLPFYVTGRNSAGYQAQVTNPIWSVEGDIGSISSTGLFTAGSVEGTGSVVATVGSLEAKATVTVTAKGWLEGVVKTPELGFAQGIIVELKENPSLMDDTDSKGKYLIANIPAGTYEARTRETALYLSASQEVTIGSGETATWSPTLTYKSGVPTIPTTTLPSF